MKKLNTSLLVLAVAVVGLVPVLGRGATTVDWDCVNDALTERDTEFSDAWAKYGADMKAAIDKRTAAMTAAISTASAIEDDGDAWLKFQELVKPVAKTYKKEVKAALKTFNKSKRVSKMEYLKAVKQDCKAPSSDVDGGGV